MLKFPVKVVIQAGMNPLLGMLLEILPEKLLGILRGGIAGDCKNSCNLRMSITYQSVPIIHPQLETAVSAFLIADKFM